MRLNIFLLAVGTFLLAAGVFLLGMSICLLEVVFCDVATLVTWLLASCDEPGSIFVQMSLMQESEKCKKVKPAVEDQRWTMAWQKLNYVALALQTLTSFCFYHENGYVIF